MVKNLILVIVGFSLIFGNTARASEEVLGIDQILLEKSVHFLTADGSTIVVDPGPYQLEAAEEWLRLNPGNRQDAILLEADTFAHEEDLSTPKATSISENEDQQYLLLLLPNGKGYEAVGTYSGIRTRRVPLRTARLARIQQATKKLPPKVLPKISADRIQPRIAEVYVPPRTVQLQNTFIGFALENLPLGSRVEVLPDFRAYPGDLFCKFIPRPGITYSPKTVDSRGKVVISGINGWFGQKTGSFSGLHPRSTCGIQLRINIFTQDGGRFQKEVLYPLIAQDGTRSPSPIQLHPRQQYHITTTWPWQQNKFRFSKISAIGACAGTAFGLGVAPDFKVGIEQFNNDISFRIRTGPIGTKCTFHSQPFSAGNGISLDAIGLRRESEGKGGCSIQEESSRFSRGGKADFYDLLQNTTDEGSSAGPRTDITLQGPKVGGMLHVHSNDDPIMTEDQVILLQNPSRNLRGVNMPLTMILVCDATLLPNEGGTRVTITDLYFSGPPNANVTP